MPPIATSAGLYAAGAILATIAIGVLRLRLFGRPGEDGAEAATLPERDPATRAADIHELVGALNAQREREGLPPLAVGELEEELERRPGLEAQLRRQLRSPGA